MSKHSDFLLFLTLGLAGSVALSPAESLAGRRCVAELVKYLQNPAKRSAMLDHLAKIAISKSPEAEKARKELQTALGFDDLNFKYFFSLYQREKNPKVGEVIEIFEAGRAAPDKTIAYPTAIAPKELLKELPYVEYSTLKGEEAALRAEARDVALWVKKMQAGTGSSMTRDTYLARMKEIDKSEVRIGAKGTDLFVDVPNPAKKGETVRISIAEMQILQSVIDAQSGVYRGVAFHDIIGPEVQDSVRAIWGKRSLLNPSKTYRQLFEESQNLAHSGESFQAYVPTLDEAKNISLNRKAPGGHALFGVDALYAAYRPHAIPEVAGSRKKVIAVVGNGEDLSSSPDALMVGWMKKHKVPIAMVTTEKTPNDLKGGMISIMEKLIPGKGGAPSKKDVYVGILEQAQAKEAKQLPLFEQIGLSVKNDDQIGFFNTNMALFNYDELSPRIHKLVDEVGEEEFFKIIAPDLIPNWKEQKDLDGVLRKYLQLEGAMGSTLLNLDRYWRAHYHEPLVHFINVGKSDRTAFFSPVKSAFDFFMQFHSDRFRVDPARMRLENLRPGKLPAVTLKDAATKDKYYQDVETVLSGFRGSSILDLETLTIDGKVTLDGASLKGKVEIINSRDELASLEKIAAAHPEVKWKRGKDGKLALENVKIEMRADGSLGVSSL